MLDDAILDELEQNTTDNLSVGTSEPEEHENDVCTVLSWLHFHPPMHIELYRVFVNRMAASRYVDLLVG